LPLKIKWVALLLRSLVLALRCSWFLKVENGVFNPGEKTVAVLAAPIFNVDLSDGMVAIRTFAVRALSVRGFDGGSGFLAA
jgi:hypothetical protein